MMPTKKCRIPRTAFPKVRLRQSGLASRFRSSGFPFSVVFANLRRYKEAKTTRKHQFDASPDPDQ